MKITSASLIATALSALPAAGNPQHPSIPELVQGFKAFAGNTESEYKYALIMMGNAMHPSYGTEEHVRIARKYFTKAAHSGHVLAMLNMAMISRTPAEARKWAQQTADAGEPLGYDILARTTQNPDKASAYKQHAIELAKARADEDHQNDWLYLYQTYSNGDSRFGIKPDDSEARRYLQLAADAGHKEARILLGIERNDRPTEEEQTRHAAYQKAHPDYTGGDGMTEQTYLIIDTPRNKLHVKLKEYVLHIYPGSEGTSLGGSQRSPGTPELYTESYLLPDGRLLRFYVTTPKDISDIRPPKP